jgi:uncharacterized membrane protein
MAFAIIALPLFVILAATTRGWVELAALGTALWALYRADNAHKEVRTLRGSIEILKERLDRAPASQGPPKLPSQT